MYKRIRLGYAESIPDLTWECGLVVLVAVVAG
jgi:hypothetical protein